MNTTDKTTGECGATACKTAGCPSIAGLMWWVTLVMAVIAVPLAGTMMALAMSYNAFVQMAAFILTCWACTWLGMWLVKKADAHQKKQQ